ncbi:MAG: YebG family protein [Deltaproteobacteria bacterium]|nr:YebG family protein [Deltaproteobacteria bacterium]
MEADRYDKMLDAALSLAELIEQSKIEIDEYALEELTIFLATNALTVKNILSKTNRTWL